MTLPHIALHILDFFNSVYCMYIAYAHTFWFVNCCCYCYVLEMLTCCWVVNDELNFSFIIHILQSGIYSMWVVGSDFGFSSHTILLKCYVDFLNYLICKKSMSNLSPTYYIYLYRFVEVKSNYLIKFHGAWFCSLGRLDVSRISSCHWIFVYKWFSTADTS